MQGLPFSIPTAVLLLSFFQKSSLRYLRRGAGCSPALIFSSLTDHKIIIITAPSGSGKTTLVRRLLKALPQLSFSISAATRAPRNEEQHGRDYYFIKEQEFRDRIDKGHFVEWEMVYEGKYYGTLKEELDRIWNAGKVPLVDIDVKGALAIQAAYPDTSLSIFIQAPSLETLRERLLLRGTESEKTLAERLSKAGFELSFATRFDRILVNDNLDAASEELTGLVRNFLSEQEAPAKART